MPHSNFAEIDFSSVTPERRAPLPITNLPVNALTDDTDPTREIRSLIETLQQNVRDVKAQAKVAEEERDSTTQQLQVARRQNEELRAHFVEITSLIRERDAALAEVEKYGRRAAEAQTHSAELERGAHDLRRQCQELEREREDFSRQRAELNRRIELLTNTSQEGSRSLAEAQRQVFSIRQARDAAQSQNREAANKLAAASERIADLKEQLEQSAADLQAAAKASAEIEGLRTGKEQALRDLEAASARIAGLDAALAAASVRQAETEAAALARQAELEAAARSEAAALQEARAALTEERDLLQAEIVCQSREIEALSLRPDQAAQAAATEMLRAEIAALEHERSTGELRVQVLSRETIDLRHQLNDSAKQVAALQQSTQQSTAALAQIQAQFTSLVQERELAEKMREEALSSLAAAQQQIEKIIRDRDLAREQARETAIGLEAQLEALRAQIAAFENPAAPGGAPRHGEISEMARLLEVREEEKREIASRLEKQRTETIDLAAQLQAAQAQIKKLGASLGEARLAAAGGLRVPPPQLGHAAGQESSLAEKASPADSFASPENYEVIRAMRLCYQAFVKSSRDVSHLNELHCHIHGFSERARAGGLVALHRLSAAFSGLAQELYCYPEQITPSALRTIGQTIEFLTTLLKVKDLRKVKDPAQAVVFSVDDDPDNCDCIRMAMETSMMKTVAATDPARALCELAETPCDLIFLDINLPGMDGFELCAEIRQLALHATTPVLFLTGMATAENRMQSSLSGGNDFVGKPFILCELTVKALTLILKAQLHLA